MNCLSENAEERIINLYGVDISVFSDGSVWIHRGNKSKRRFGNLTGKGYMNVLIRDNGVLHTVFVHKLVAMAFIPNPDNKPQINHINGIRKDNRPENLEWCTNAENAKHRGETLNHYGLGKPIRCKETGIVYRTIKHASRYTHINRANISGCITGRRKTAGGYHWERIEGDIN